jgi:hypothetical protein
LWREARKRRVVIYEKEQNKDKVNECGRELPTSIASPAVQLYQGYTREAGIKVRNKPLD